MVMNMAMNTIEATKVDFAMSSANVGATRTDRTFCTISFSTQNPSKFAKSVTGKAIDAPPFQRSGAQSLVKTDRGFVPIEHCPIDPTAVSINSDFGQVTNECAADAVAPGFGENKQVFEVQARLRQKGREGVKEKGKANRLASTFRDHDLGIWSVAKEGRLKCLLGCDDLVE